MKKKAIDFPKSIGKSVEFDMGTNKVEVIKYLSLATQEALVELYLEAYFGETRFGNDTDVFGAEMILDLAILDLATNVNIHLKKFSMDKAYESGLIDTVRQHISNYDSLRMTIDRCVSDGARERFSAKGLWKQLVVSFSELDVEKIKEIGKEIANLQDGVEGSPLAGLFEEGKKG